MRQLPLTVEPAPALHRSRTQHTVNKTTAAFIEGLHSRTSYNFWIGSLVIRLPTDLRERCFRLRYRCSMSSPQIVTTVVSTQMVPDQLVVDGSHLFTLNRHELSPASRTRRVVLVGVGCWTCCTQSVAHTVVNMQPHDGQAYDGLPSSLSGLVDGQTRTGRPLRHLYCPGCF